MVVEKGRLPSEHGLLQLIGVIILRVVKCYSLVCSQIESLWRLTCGTGECGYDHVRVFYVAYVYMGRGL